MNRKREFKRSSGEILAEVIAAVVLCYFLLGGSEWMLRHGPSLPLWQAGLFL